MGATAAKCGATCYRCLTYVSCSRPCVRFCICIPRCCRRAQQISTWQVEALPPHFEDFLREGQLFTALILATNFSEKYKGRSLQTDAIAEVRFPEFLARPAWQTKLLGRYGFREACPFVWIGDPEAGDQTLYVAFGPLRKKRQHFKLWMQGSNLVDDEVYPDGVGQMQTPHRFKIANYMKMLLDKLWPDFSVDLERFASDFPRAKIFFSGISHGASVAQAAALRFALQYPAYTSRIFVGTFNAYKWTDESGKYLAGQVFGDRVLPFILSSTSADCCCRIYRRWDSVPEFPPGFSPMPNSMLLDAHSGEFFRPDHQHHGTSFFVGNARMGFDFASRMRELHFATAARIALQVAMRQGMRNDNEQDQVSGRGVFSSGVDGLLSREGG